MKTCHLLKSIRFRILGYKSYETVWFSELKHLTAIVDNRGILTFIYQLLVIDKHRSPLFIYLTFLGRSTRLLCKSHTITCYIHSSHRKDGFIQSLFLFPCSLDGQRMEREISASLCSKNQAHIIEIGLVGIDIIADDGILVLTSQKLREVQLLPIV